MIHRRPEAPWDENRALESSEQEKTKLQEALESSKREKERLHEQKARLHDHVAELQASESNRNSFSESLRKKLKEETAPITSPTSGRRKLRGFATRDEAVKFEQTCRKDRDALKGSRFPGTDERGARAAGEEEGAGDRPRSWAAPELSSGILQRTLVRA